MKRLANSISLAKLAISLKKEKALAKQLQRILRLAQSSPIPARPAVNDIDDNLADSARFQEAPTDVFSQMRALVDCLNKAPSEIRNAPETSALIKKIFMLMTDHADSDRQVA